MMIFNFLSINVTSSDFCNCADTVGGPFYKITTNTTSEQLDKYCKGCSCVFQTRNVGIIAISWAAYMGLLVILVIYRLTSCTVPEDKLGRARYRRSRTGSRTFATNSLELEKFIPQQRRDSVCSVESQEYFFPTHRDKR